MTLTITVTTPIIINGQYLKVEYSTDGTNYTFDSYQSSNTFTTSYSGFTAGTTYYFRFTVVKSLSPLVECDSVVKTYSIPSEIDCLEWDASLVKGDENQYFLNIYYTPPSPYVAPCGGYVIRYGTSYPLQSISYISLPASPILIPASNQIYYVEMYALDCEGNDVLCGEFEVHPTVSECTHSVIASSSLYQSAGNFFLQFSITPSNPASLSYGLSFTQTNPIVTGLPDIGSTSLYPTGGNPETFTVQVFPNLSSRENKITYTGNITDGCKWANTFTVNLSL